MPGIQFPGVYVEEMSRNGHAIHGVDTSVTAFVGYTQSGVVNTPMRITSFTQFERDFGPLSHDSPVSYATRQFFLNGGSDARVVRVVGADGGRGSASDLSGDSTLKTGVYALLHLDLFNLLVVPETFDMQDGQEAAVVSAGVALCEAQRAFYIVDAPSHCDLRTISAWASMTIHSSHAATYFPAVRVPDPLDENRPRLLAPSGTVAGVYARTDNAPGVWKAPAGGDATLIGVTELAVLLNNQQNDLLNPQGINALRQFPQQGRLIWGSRTLAGSDRQAHEYKYVPVRRLALYIEQSVCRGTEWVAFESRNDETLWRALRLDVEAFLKDLLTLGALKGKTAGEAFFVKCDGETTTQNDVNLGRVNVWLGFAPVKPAEFLIIKLRILTLRT